MYRGNINAAPLSLNFPKWRWVVFTPRPLYPGQRTAVLTERDTGWVVERDWKFWRRDNSPALVGIRTPEHPACNLVAVQSAVSIYVLVFQIQIYPIYRAFQKRFEHLLLWPPRSPDLTPCDFFLWGYVKDNAYKPQTVRSHSSCGANHWRGTS
jgi:hypothetical protein